jgi:histidinol-phosphate aminotransferase
MQGRSPLDVIKPEVRELTAYTLKHTEADVKLDQNENPHEIPDDLKQAVLQRVMARSWGRYPEFVPASITNALSKFTNWPAEGILVGNGSNELIQSTLSVTLGPGRTLGVPQPTFTLYKLMAAVLQSNMVSIPLKEHDFSFDSDGLLRAASASDVLVICSPNNPTGSLLDHETLSRILETAKGLVVVDEAYHEFSRQTVVDLLPKHHNLVVLRTLSKAMSLAALRFGYLMAHPEIAREIYKGKLPYNVNVFTLAAAELVIERRKMLDETIDKVIAERDRLLAELKNRRNVESFPSTANFILIRSARPARELFNALLAQGILVRDVSSYPMLERALRVTVGRRDENDRFLQALDRALENPS